MGDHDTLMLEQFYKPEENTVLFGLYKILCSQTKQPTYMTYSDLSKAFNSKKQDRKRTNKAYEKINNQDVAHYCKKLEKCGFVCITSQRENSEKLISLAR